MFDLKMILLKRGIAFWFMLVSVGCTIAALILYVLTGVNEFTPDLSGKVIALLSVSLACSVFLSAFEVKLGKYVAFLFGFWAWLEYLITQVNYFANIFAAIDGSSFSAAFILTALFSALGWIAALVSAILQKREFGSAGTEA